MDIVKRLREGRTNGTDLRWSVTDAHREAATEIERLREVLKFIVAYSDCHQSARDAARRALGEMKPLEDRWDNE